MKSLVFLLFALFTLDAKVLEVSQRVEAIELESQHGQKHRLLENGVWIIAWSKETTSVANTYFSKHKMPKDANLIIDTSAIPSGIFSLFVHPKMKKFKHTMLFSFNREFNLKLPYKEDSLTLLFIEDARVAKVLFASSTKELKESLK